MESKNILLPIDELCEYAGIAKTKAKELIAKPNCKYVVRIGRRVLIHKELFDEEVKKAAKYQITL